MVLVDPPNPIEDFDDQITVGALDPWDDGETILALNARFRNAIREALVAAGVRPEDTDEWIGAVFERWVRGRAEMQKSTSVVSSLQYAARQVARVSHARSGAGQPVRASRCRIRADGFYGSGEP